LWFHFIASSDDPSMPFSGQPFVAPTSTNPDICALLEGDGFSFATPHRRLLKKRKGVEALVCVPTLQLTDDN
jgi:hypothetical protein